VALFVAALVVWFVLRVADVLLLMFLAVLAAVYFSAITDQLERRFRMPRWVGLLCAVGGTIAVVVGTGALVVPPVIDQTQALLSGLPQTLTDIQGVIAHWAGRYDVLRRTGLADPQSGIIARVIDDAADYLRGSLLPYLRAGGKLFIEGASVLVMALYLARQPRLYHDGVLALVSPKHRKVGERILDDPAAPLRARHRTRQCRCRPQEPVETHAGGDERVEVPDDLQCLARLRVEGGEPSDEFLHLRSGW